MLDFGYCRSSRGSVDWNPCIRFENQIMLWSLLSWERGLKLSSAIVNFLMVCRSSRGSVDWNQRIIKHHQAIRVAPLVGAWIEITDPPQSILFTSPSLLSWERGLKLQRGAAIRTLIHRRSSRGSVDWNLLVRANVRFWILSLLSWERGLKSTYHQTSSSH